MKRASTKFRLPIVKKVRRPSASRPRRNDLRQGECEYERLLAMRVIDQEREIRRGIKAAVLVQVAHGLLRIPLEELLTGLHLPPSKIQRKIRIGARLSGGESCRVSRALIIFQQAVDAFDDKGLAADWFQRRNVELGGERPLDLLDTRPGFERVSDVLARLVFGISV
jgi:putative toxin-antitoxin system antitoxin component (TIGR02293 family)